MHHCPGTSRSFFGVILGVKAVSAWAVVEDTMTMPLLQTSTRTASNVCVLIVAGVLGGGSKGPDEEDGTCDETGE